MGKKLKNNKGYSLVEVIVAGAFIAAVIVGIFGVISQGATINREQLLTRRAYEEAERILEYTTYSSGNYLNLSTGHTDSTGNMVLDARKGNISVIATSTVYTEGVSYTCSGITIPAKKIYVTIAWTDNGKNYSVVLGSAISYADIN